VTKYNSPTISMLTH